MQIIRQIQNEKHYAKEIWRFEMSLPRIFRDANFSWTPNYKSFRKFWNSCGEIWGLIDETRGCLLSCIYLEFERPDSINIHLSVLENIGPADLARFFSALRSHKQSEGVWNMQAWVLSKNRSLREIIKISGFVESGLRMDFGASRGKVLNWVEYRG